MVGKSVLPDLLEAIGTDWTTWSYGLALGSSRFIGLDIGTTTVKAARICRKGSRVTVVGVAQMGISGADHADAPADQKIALGIWGCLRQLRSNSRGVISGLAGSEVAVRTFEFPPMPRKQLASAVELEASQVCPFDLHESTVAWQVLQSGPKAGKSERIVGLFAAAKNDIVRRRQQLCEGGRTSCLMIDVNGLALLNCLEACGLREPRQAVLVLNVGQIHTNLAIIGDDGLPFVRDINYAGDHIISHISKAVGLSKPAVLAALTSAEGAEGAAVKLRPSLQEACSGLADRVIETARYYGTRKSGPAVSRVFLCGGMAAAPAFVETMVPILPGTVELWNPLKMLPCARAVRKSQSVEQGPLFAVALGLAMRSLRDVHD